MNTDEKMTPRRKSRVWKRKTNGIKAVVPLSVLSSLIVASKKHCAICKLQLDAVSAGEHTQCANCKLARNVDYAEAALKKWERRNKTAFDIRCERRDKAKAEAAREGSCADELYGEAETKPEFNLTAGAMDGLDAARPTRW